MRKGYGEHGTLTDLGAVHGWARQLWGKAAQQWWDGQGIQRVMSFPRILEEDFTSTTVVAVLDLTSR